VQLDSIDRGPPRSRPRGNFAEGQQSDAPAEQHGPVRLHEIANADDEERDSGQWFVAQHLVEDRFKSRDDEDQEKDHDPQGEKQHNDGVDHRGHDLVPDLLCFLLEFREAGQDQFEDAATSPARTMFT